MLVWFGGLVVWPVWVYFDFFVWLVLLVWFALLCFGFFLGF